mgnify:CR=1 FL=1
MKKTKRTRRMKLRKDMLTIVLVVLLWTILSIGFLAKITGPSLKLFIVKDNYVYSQQYASPNNYDVKDDAYREYNDYANSLINSEDVVISTFFKADSLQKLAMFGVAIIPFIIILKFFTTPEKKSSKKRKNYSRTNKVTARA